MNDTLPLPEIHSANTRIASSLLSSVPEMIGQFCSWWGSELQGLMPNSWTSASPPVVTLGTKEVCITTGEGEVRFDKPLLTFSDTENAKLQSMLSDRSFLVALDSNVLTLALSLTMAAERSLASAVHYQLMSKAPMPLDQLLYDFTVSGRDKAKQTLYLDVRMVKFAFVQKLTDYFAGLGLVPQVIGGGAMLKHRLSFQFQKAGSGLVPDDAARRRRLQLMLSGLIALGCLPLLTMIADHQAAKQEQQNQVVQEELRARLPLKPMALALAHEGEEVRRLLQAPHRSQQVVLLADALGQTVWLDQLQLGKREIHLSGFASDPDQVLVRLQHHGVWRAWSWRTEEAASTASMAKPKKGQRRFALTGVANP
jgi:hypothetical protein